MLAFGGIGLYVLLGRLFPGPMSAILDGVTIERSTLIQYALLRLLVGIALIWIYAAARFRLRSTPRTAARIGIAVWFLAYIPLAWLFRFLDILPRPVVLVIVAWGLVETVLAALAGGLVHQLTRPDDARY